MTPLRVRRPAEVVPSGSATGDYRPALDGVRAVAVLGVIAYHVTDGKPSGGFLGVDIFFVLSGYLITTLLLRAWTMQGRVRLSEFWARRARRLLPALMILVAAVAVWVGRNAPVSTWPARRADMISTLVYYANWHFIATDQSYFAALTGVSPLRHMWSVAIEEQFYVVWPLVVVAALSLRRRGRRLLLAFIAVGTAVSVARMALLFDAADPSRAYLATDARAHELLIGAGLAVLLVSRPRALTYARARLAARWLSPAVALAVLAAFAVLKEKSSFYYHGGSALFALLVGLGLWAIEAAPNGTVGRLLSWAPVRWVGRISYGLYLWHWPMVLWLDNRVEQVVATFATASASFYLVERPVRYGLVPWLRLSRLRIGIVLSAAMGLVVTVVLETTTLRSTPSREVSDASYTPCPGGSPQIGTGQFGASVNGATWCSRTAPASPSSSVVATVGDSTSTALDPGMRALAHARGWRYIQAGVPGCPVLLLGVPPHDAPVDAREARSCERYVPVLLSDVEDKYRPSVWIVSDVTGLEPQDARGMSPHRAEALLDTMRRMIREMTANGAHVVVLAPPPVAQPLECATRRPVPPNCSYREFTTSDPLTIVQARLFRQAPSQFPRKVVYVSLDDILCPHHTCPPLIDGQLARYDTVHYTRAFSRKLVPEIIARAERAGVGFSRP